MSERTNTYEGRELVRLILLIAFMLPAITTFGDAPSWGAWITAVCQFWGFTLPLAVAFAAGYRYGDRVVAYALRWRRGRGVEKPGCGGEDETATG